MVLDLKHTKFLPPNVASALNLKLAHLRLNIVDSARTKCIITNTFTTNKLLLVTSAVVYVLHHALTKPGFKATDCACNEV